MSPDRVNSKQTFLHFISQLRADWEASELAERQNPSPPFGPKHGYWENPNLRSFLRAMQDWAEDMGDQVPECADWQTFATMLLAGKGYE